MVVNCITEAQTATRTRYSWSLLTWSSTLKKIPELPMTTRNLSSCTWCQSHQLLSSSEISEALFCFRSPLLPEQPCIFTTAKPRMQSFLLASILLCSGLLGCFLTLTPGFFCCCSGLGCPENEHDKFPC